MPAGIFIMYHHSLGIITDAQALLYDVPALVVAHLGLPHSHATQISGALRLRYMREKAKELLSASSGSSGSNPMPLKVCQITRVAQNGFLGLFFDHTQGFP